MKISDKLLKKLYGEGAHGEVTIFRGRVSYYANEGDTIPSFRTTLQLLDEIKELIVNSFHDGFEVKADYFSKQYCVRVGDIGACTMSELESFIDVANRLLERESD